MDWVFSTSGHCRTFPLARMPKRHGRDLHIACCHAWHKHNGFGHLQKLCTVRHGLKWGSRTQINVPGNRGIIHNGLLTIQRDAFHSRGLFQSLRTLAAPRNLRERECTTVPASFIERSLGKTGNTCMMQHSHLAKWSARSVHA